MLRPLWDPVSVQINQLPCAFNHLLGIEFRKAKLPMTSIHPLIVLVNSKHVYLPRIIFFFIRLCTFETLNTVVQCCIRWIQRQLFEWLYLWNLPPTILPIKVTNKHVIREYPSKNILMIFTRLFILFFRLFNHQVFSIKSLIMRRLSLILNKSVGELLTSADKVARCNGAQCKMLNWSREACIPVKSS